MKNIERIKKFTDYKFSEYIESVFIAGRLYELNKGKSLDKDFDMVDYVEWLNEEETDETWKPCDE